MNWSVQTEYKAAKNSQKANVRFEISTFKMGYR